MPLIKPFQTEEEFLQIDDLTIEDRLDRVQFYGSIHITRDRAGLKLARLLKEIIDLTVSALEREKNLPDRITIENRRTEDRCLISFYTPIDGTSTILLLIVIGLCLLRVFFQPVNWYGIARESRDGYFWGN